MYFEANRGQTDPRVKFVSRGAGYSVILTQTEVVSGNATNPRRASDSHHRQERRCHAGGAVAKKADKDLAGLLTNGVSGIFSVKNNLFVEK